jgi:hypothetical protein
VPTILPDKVLVSAGGDILRLKNPPLSYERAQSRVPKSNHDDT